MKLPFQIVEETDDWIAVVKPAGLLVERSPYFPSVEEYLIEYFSQKKKKPFVGVVHRLDRLVGGILLFAKKKSTLKILNEAFQNRKVKKFYKAILENNPPSPKGILTHWIEKDRKNKRAIPHPKHHEQGKQSILKYNVEQTDEKGTLVNIQLVTGRFHQIRAQFSANSCPIIGDEKYGAKTAFAENAIGLFSYRLIIESQTINLEVELPSSFSL